MEQNELPCSAPLPQAPAAYDRAVFERVWRRVMPEERPDCPIRLEGASAAPTSAPLYHAAPLPDPIVPDSTRSAPAVRTAPPDQGAPQADDVPCLGASSAVYGPRLQDLIDHELADWHTYQALARRAPGGGGRVLSTLAADERRHAKRLSTAYFLISGVRYWPAERAVAAPMGTYPGMLRHRFAAEQRGEAAYLAAAADCADPCLQELFADLAGEENAHAWLLRSILEQL